MLMRHEPGGRPCVGRRLTQTFLLLQKAPLVGSGIGFCASVSGAVDSAHGSEAQGSAGLAAYKTQARASVMGEKCRLPLVYGCALDQTP